MGTVPPQWPNPTPYGPSPSKPAQPVPAAIPTSPIGDDGPPLDDGTE